MWRNEEFMTFNPFWVLYQNITNTIRKSKILQNNFPDRDTEKPEEENAIVIEDYSIAL